MWPCRWWSRGVRVERDAADAVAPPCRSAPAAVETRLPLRPRVVFLGDSLTAGYGLPKEQAAGRRSSRNVWTRRVQLRGRQPWSVWRHLSAGGVSRLDWALTGDVRVLVIELGANDGLRGTAGRIDEGESVRHHHAREGARRGRPADRDGSAAESRTGIHGAVRQAFADLAREHKVAFVPFYLEGVAGNPALNISDGIHPNAEGAAIVEKTVWKALEPLLEQDRLKQVRLKADTTSDQ